MPIGRRSFDPVSVFETSWSFLKRRSLTILVQCRESTTLLYDVIDLDVKLLLLPHFSMCQTTVLAHDEDAESSTCH